MSSSPSETGEEAEKELSFPLRQWVQRLRCDPDPQGDKPLNEVTASLSEAEH